MYTQKEVQAIFDKAFESYEYHTQEDINIYLIAKGAEISVELFGVKVLGIAYLVTKTNIYVRTELVEKEDSILGHLNRLVFRKHGDLFSCVDVDDKTIIDEFVKHARAIYEYSYTLKETHFFGCCHRFEECSNAKKCIHPNILIAKGCGYKTNLDNDRIFYGKNKNI